MSSIKLTDRYVASVTVPEKKRIDLFDTQIAGLMLRVSGSGRKTFYLRYRVPNGRQPRYKLGTYPALKLADARDAAVRFLGQITLGLDPARERRKLRDDAKAQTIRTFGELAAAYFDACESGEWKARKKKKRKRTLDDDRAVYRRYVEASLSNTRLQEITVKIVKALLRGMISRGIHAQTNRTQAFIRQVFNYGIDAFEGELVTSNPAALKPLAEVHVRTRVLNDAEISSFYGRLADPSKFDVETLDTLTRGFLPARPMRIVLQLCVLLLLRESEVAGMQIIELDLENATWIIPADRMKGGLAHLVPLAPVVVELIREAISLRSDPTSPYVFPSPRTKTKKPFKGDSVGHAMARLVTALGMSSASPHDLRRTGSTILTSERLGVSPLIRSRVLGHYSDTGRGAAVSAKHYDLNEYVSEKRAALAGWTTLVLKIVRKSESFPSGDVASRATVAELV